MAHVADLLDRLAAGRLTVDEVVADFRSRDWPPVRPTTVDEAVLGADPAYNGPDSWDVVNADSRLTSPVYALLAAAYQDAIQARK